MQRNQINVQNVQNIFIAATVISIAILVYVAFTLKPFHTVPEGHIGVYWRFGALLTEHTDPGLHFSNPLTTKVGFVQITMQTDTVKDIPCGTSSGVMIYFDKIEVVNSITPQSALNTVRMYGEHYDRIWIFDKIHHEINQFCSKHTLQEVYIEKFENLDEALSTALQNDCDKYETGIMINAIRVTKPRIPEKVRVLYEQVEGYKAELMVAMEQMAVVQRQEETLKMQQVIRAEREAEVAIIAATKEANVSKIVEAQKTSEAKELANRTATVSIINQMMLTAQKEGMVNRSRIDNDMTIHRIETQAKSRAFTLEREAEGLNYKLTPEFILYETISAFGKILGSNTTFYLGDKIPSTFINLNKEAIAPLFDKIMKK